jgi:hypothetical protein
MATQRRLEGFFASAAFANSVPDRVTVAVLVDRGDTIVRRAQREVGAGGVEGQPDAGHPVQCVDYRAVRNPAAAVEGGHPVDRVRHAYDRGLR